MTGAPPPHTGPRTLVPSDSRAARLLVEITLGVTPYLERVLELLASAERGDAETRGIVAERGGTVTALALYGPVAGAASAWRIRMMILAPQAQTSDGRAMVNAIVDEVQNAGGRLLLAELPADALLGRTLSLLRASGFRQESRIPDFYREGVALLFLRRDI